jgi:hypothetical protein
MTPGRWFLAVAWLAIVVGLPLLGHALRRPQQGRCAVDGEPVDPAYGARVVNADGTSLDFCCLLCAERWLESAPPPRAILVTDEISGQMLPANDAYYVRSSVVTQPATGNRVHVFARRSDALRHAKEARGKLLGASEQPLRAFDPLTRDAADGS